jgi:hypothetical protein
MFLFARQTVGSFVRHTAKSDGFKISNRGSTLFSSIVRPVAIAGVLPVGSFTGTRYYSHSKLGSHIVQFETHGRLGRMRVPARSFSGNRFDIPPPPSSFPSEEEVMELIEECLKTLPEHSRDAARAEMLENYEVLNGMIKFVEDNENKLPEAEKAEYVADILEKYHTFLLTTNTTESIKGLNNNDNNDTYRFEESTSPFSTSSSSSNSSKFGTFASLGVAASFLAGKSKFLLVGLKLTKATPLISMVLTSFAYSFFFGWPYAVGMVGLIFAHELGHALVLMRYGKKNKKNKKRRK